MIIIGRIEETKTPKCRNCGGPLGNVSLNGICFACIHASVCEAELINELNKYKEHKEDKDVKKYSKTCKKFMDEMNKQKEKAMAKLPNMLTQFIKDKKNRPYGVMIAKKINGDNPVIKIGVSLCNTKVDAFNKKMGIEIALKRCLSNETYTIHASGLRDFNEPFGGCYVRIENMTDFSHKLFWFMERASRYFKDLPIIYPSNMNLV